jgi:hypothetical protein
VGVSGEPPGGGGTEDAWDLSRAGSSASGKGAGGADAEGGRAVCQPEAFQALSDLYVACSDDELRLRVRHRARAQRAGARCAADQRGAVARLGARRGVGDFRGAGRGAERCGAAESGVAARGARPAGLRGRCPPRARAQGAPARPALRAAGASRRLSGAERG